MERRKQSDDEIKSLIDLYESKHSLWDIFFKDYSKCDIKEKALNEISEELSVPTEDIKQKWMSLHAQFGRELKSSINRVDRAPTNCTLVSRSFMTRCNFLQPMMKTKKSHDSLDITDSSDPVSTPNPSSYDEDEQCEDGTQTNVKSF